MPLPTSLYNYHLPPSAIAQHPADRRDHSRLMVIYRATREIEHRYFYELPEILASVGRKAVLFRNNAKVIKARLWLKRMTGAEIELLLLRPSTDSRKWWCLAKPLKKISIGENLFYAHPLAPSPQEGEDNRGPAGLNRVGPTSAVALAKEDSPTPRLPSAKLGDPEQANVCERGGIEDPEQASLKTYLENDLTSASKGETTYPRANGVADAIPVATLLEKSPTGEALFEFAEDPLVLSEKIGALPLPPYIARKPHDENEAEDTIRYQTVYAKEKVAAAAPTAGLHFTPELISKLESQGHRFADLTLHVGLDTFRPIGTETVEEHKIHTETYEVSSESQNLLKNKNEFLKLAVGTTSLRTMEDFTRKNFPSELRQSASLFIYPPQTILSADALITNFHLPKSTLLCLVSAFLTPGSLEGIAWLKSLYAEALGRGYRFYSYGDAMLIL